MNFEQALIKLREGQAITDGDVVIEPGELVKDMNLTMSMQCDWEVYEEPKWEPQEGNPALQRP